MRIQINCASCGSNNFELADAQTDDCGVSCAECGHVIGTLGQLKAKLAEEVIRRSNQRHANAGEETANTRH
jgi:uncharacterized Zn finger protein